MTAPEIVILTPDGNRRTVKLSAPRYTLGRSSANELCYPEDAGLSRHHLAFERDGVNWSVRDLGSKNGTLVNGVRIQEPHRLNLGDRIVVGHLVVDFGRTPEPSSDTIIVFQNKPPVSESTLVTSLEGVLAEDAKALEGAADASALQSSLQVKALVKAGRELAGHRPLQELFRVILDLSVEAVGADRGVLITVEGDQFVVRAARGDRFTISTTVRDKVINERVSVLVRDATLDRAFKEQRSIVAQNVRSMIAVPLQTSDRVIGLIYVDSPFFVRDFGKEELNLLTVMANVAAIRIEHARLAEVEQAEKVMSKELEQAAEIQRRLLPARAPVFEGLDLAGYNAPCHTVGGDYFDFFRYPDGRAVIVVGDVAGKGMPAALLMSSLQARVQVLLEEADDLSVMVNRLNRTISSNCPANRFISFFICVIDAATGDVTYCNCGHNPPLVVRQSGTVERLEGGGLILGILPNARYQTYCARLNPADMLVLFSDGVTEAVNSRGEEYGEERLGRLALSLQARSAGDIVQTIVQDVEDFVGDAPPNDDITLVLARRLP